MSATPPTFDVVYREWVSYVFRTLRRLGVPERHLADATQDVFIHVRRLLPRYDARRDDDEERRRSRFRAWLCAIASNVAAQYRRSEHRSPVMSDEHHAAHTPDPTANPERITADRELVLRLLDALSPERRTVFIMHEIDQCTTAEIAAALEIPEGTVKTRLAAAKEDFAEAHKRLAARDRHAATASVIQLLAAEREITPIPPEVEEEIWQRIQATPEIQRDQADDGAGGDAVPRVARPPVQPMLKLGLALGVGVAIGAAWSPRTRTPPDVPAPVVVAAAVTTVAAPPAAVVTAVPVVPLVTAVPVIAVALVSTAPPASATPTSSAAASQAAQDEAIAAERALLRKATNALSAGNSAEALAVVEELEHRFRGGQLAAERDAARIAALTIAGQVDEASARLNRFALAYPNNPRIPELRRELAERRERAPREAP